MKKAFLGTYAIVLISLGLMAGATPVVSAQASFTEVAGEITSNTTWTKAGSPYLLTGDINVTRHATLTIEPGVSVDLDSHRLQIDGTLTARGTSAEPIFFDAADKNYAEIIFTNYSKNWSEQTGKGCIIENAIVSTTINVYANSFSQTGFNVYNITPKINNNTIYRINVAGGSPTISNNTITEKITVHGGLPKFLHNNIVNETYGSFYVSGGAPEISYNTIAGGIEERGYFYFAPVEQVISHNTITSGGIDIDHYGHPVKIFNNSVSGSGYGYAVKVIGISSVIRNNIITGKGDVGIYVPNKDSSISGNTIFGCTTGIISSGKPTTIERNVIVNNTENGIDASEATIRGNLISNNRGIGVQARNCIVQNNTIVDNSIGIYLKEHPSTITLNNIEDNAQNSVYLQAVSSDVNATYNWWGTTGSQRINQTIHDFKEDASLSTVNFIPFLTAENAETLPSNVPAPTPTQTPTTTPTPSPTSTPLPTPTPTLTPTPSASASTSPTATQTSTEGELDGVAIGFIATGIVIAAVVAGALMRRKRAHH